MKNHWLTGLFMALLIPNTFIAQSYDYQNQPLDSVLAWLGREVYQNNTPAFRQIAWYVVEQAQKNADLQKLATAHEHLGTWHYYYGLFGTDSAFYHDQKVVDIYTELNDQALLAKALDRLSTDHINLAQYPEALQCIFQSLEIFEQLGDEQGVADAYHNLCTIYKLMEEPDNAVHYGTQAVSKFLELDQPVSAAIVHFNLSKAYLQKRDLDKALESMQASVDLIEEHGEARDKYAMLRAYTFRGEVYQEMNNYDAAQKDFEYVLEKAREFGGQNLVDGYSSSLGNLLRLKGQYAEALPLIMATLEHSKAYMNHADLWEQYQTIKECYQGMGEYEKSLEYADMAMAERDSMLLDRITNLESELEVKYATEQKNTTIAEQQQRISQQQKIQLLFIGLFILAAVLLGVVYSNYRSKQKINQQLQQLNRQINKKADENALLLKEIHHRVKNNLQVISSLLSLHSENVQDPEAVEVMLESQNRVRSMGLIHQKLYQGDDLAAIEMKDYFQDLGESMLDSFGLEGEKIQIKYPMDKIELDVDTAIPVGLIVNELLTNSLKHAFRNKQDGEIEISLQAKDEEQYVLRVKDNGQASTGGGAASSGFGTQLVQLLVHQLDGHFEKKQKAGTEIILEFKPQSAA